MATYLADWADGSAASFADKARTERAKDMVKLMAELAAIENKAKLKSA
jgi:hypothetical protein